MLGRCGATERFDTPRDLRGGHECRLSGWNVAGEGVSELVRIEEQKAVPDGGSAVRGRRGAGPRSVC